MQFGSVTLYLTIFIKGSELLKNIVNNFFFIIHFYNVYIYIYIYIYAAPFFENYAKLYFDAEYLQKELNRRRYIYIYIYIYYMYYIVLYILYVLYIIYNIHIYSNQGKS